MMGWNEVGVDTAVSPSTNIRFSGIILVRTCLSWELATQTQIFRKAVG